MKKLIVKYKYVVWVGGCDDYYVYYRDAKRAYNSWLDKGYNDVCIERI